MKIRCPNCGKITELEHVDHGSLVECVCSYVFTVNESTVTEEFTEVDSRLPERIGQYPVNSFIGFGGMGKVYLAIHPNLGIPVAIKTLRVEYTTDRASCDRFVQSAKICARINHPNIVRIYDCGYENDNVFLVMEYISGGSAQNLLEQEGKLDPEHAAFIMLEVCSGLMEAEKYGIVHRDIKPENIMFDEEGTVKILDLGLSKIIGDRRLSQQNITASLTSLGTPLYMAPEQAVDAANCDSRADIYSIGVTLYQFCTGKLPFDSDDPHELRRMHALEKPLPPRQLEPSLRPDMEMIILRCMEKRREDRYASVADLALDLEAYLKNRVLPSTFQLQAASARSVRRQKRGFRRQFLEFRRKTAVLFRHYGWLVAGISVLMAASVIGPVLLNPVMPKKSRQTPLSTAKILSGLSRQAAFYTKTQDYDSIIALYQDYCGPLAKETKATRLRIAEGYRLTRKQAADALRMELAELTLKGRHIEAWTLYKKRKGYQFCPGCEVLLRELSRISDWFHHYWMQYIGRELELSLRHRGKTVLKIAALKGNEVYAIPRHQTDLIHFTLNDLPLSEQLRIIGLNCSSREIPRIWTGLYQQRAGRHQQAVSLLKNTPELGGTFERLLTDGKWLPASGKDSGRNQ